MSCATCWDSDVSVFVIPIVSARGGVERASRGGHPGGIDMSPAWMHANLDAGQPGCGPAWMHASTMHALRAQLVVNMRQTARSLEKEVSAMPFASVRVGRT